MDFMSLSRVLPKSLKSMPSVDKPLVSISTFFSKHTYVRVSFTYFNIHIRLKNCTLISFDICRFKAIYDLRPS